MNQILGLDSRIVQLWGGQVSVRPLTLADWADVARYVRQKPAREAVKLAEDMGKDDAWLNRRLAEANRQIREDRRTDQEIIEAMAMGGDFESLVYQAWLSIKYTGKSLADVRALSDAELMALIGSEPEAEGEPVKKNQDQAGAAVTPIS